MGKIYTHFTLEERFAIARLRADGQSQSKIASALGRSESSISRELKRNSSSKKGYKAEYASDLAWARRRRESKLKRQPELRSRVLNQLAMGWSPQQVAGRLAIDDPSNKISHESIYRFIYSEIKRTNDGAYRHYLPRMKSKRGRPGARFNPVKAIPNRVSISERPAHVETREEIGHWEADLLHPRKNGAAILVAVERKTRLVLLAKMPTKEAAPIADKLSEWFKPMPEKWRQTITTDNGTEFFHHYKLNEFNIKTYFCKPHQPWQKGGVENSNGRIRRYIPLGTDPDTFSDEDIQDLANQLNNTPRKCLGYKTPAEAFIQNTLHFKCESTSPPSPG